MIVRCVSPRNSIKNIRYSLTAGKTYPVLAVELYDRSKTVFCNSFGDFCLYRIRDEERNIKLFPSSLFEVVSDEIPSNWVFFRDSEDSWTLLPKSLARRFFWDDFYNDAPEAVAEMQRVEEGLGAST